MTNSVGDNTLEHLEAWVQQCLSSNATPKEIYDSIVKIVKEESQYHKDHHDRAQDLVLLLKGNLSALYDLDNDPLAGKVDMGGPIENPYFSSAEEGSEWVKENGGYEYTPLPNIPSRY